MSPKRMTMTELVEVMRYQLINLGTCKRVNKSTVHSKCFDPKDYASHAKYRCFVTWTLLNQGHKEKSWPSNWMDMTIAVLADVII